MDESTLLTNIWAAILAFAVFMYVVMDGFDLGIGILFPVFGVGRERDTAMNSIAPVWDGNETWLVLGGGGLMAAFPLAYAVVKHRLMDMELIFRRTLVYLLGLGVLLAGVGRLVSINQVGLPEPLCRNETVEPVDGLDHVDVAVPAVERLVLARLGVAEDDHEVGAHVAAPPRPLPGILRESWLTAMATGRTSMTRRFGLSSSRANAAGSAGCIRDVNFGRNHSRVARSR